MAIGYAVRIEGDIDLRTLSITMQAAMVNYLWVHKKRLVTSNWTYNDIIRSFKNESAGKDELCEVEVKFLKVISNVKASNRS